LNLFKPEKVANFHSSSNSVITIQLLRILKLGLQQSVQITVVYLIGKSPTGVKGPKGMVGVGGYFVSVNSKPHFPGDWGEEDRAGHNRF
jgi:hypothetical protein